MVDNRTIPNAGAEKVLSDAFNTQYARAVAASNTHRYIGQLEAIITVLVGEDVNLARRIVRRLDGDVNPVAGAA